MQQRYFPRMGGASKNVRLPLPRATAGNNQRGSLITFRTSGNWTAPLGVRYLNYARGNGSDGRPESGSHSYEDAYITYSQVVNQDAQGNTTAEPEVNEGTTAGAIPANYCGDYIFNPDGSAQVTCYRYEYTTIDNGDYQPATPGTDATGFGKVFPGGGVGVSASPVIFSNIKVTPGGVYSVIVPAGGYITFEY